MKRILPALVVAGGLLLPAVGMAWCSSCTWASRRSSRASPARRTRRTSCSRTRSSSAHRHPHLRPVGFNLMYPGDFNGFLGFAGFGISSADAAGNTPAYADGGYTYWTDFLFQAMFAATAATIVSGRWPSASSSRLHDLLDDLRRASSTRSPAPGSGAAAGSTPRASTTSPAPPWSTRSAAGAP